MPRPAPEETIAVRAGLDALVDRRVITSWTLEVVGRGRGGQGTRLWWITLNDGKEWGLERKEIMFLLELGASLP